MTKDYQILKEVIQQNIDNSIKNSGLDIGAVYFILKDIFSDIEKMYYSKINSELLEESKNTEKDKNDNTVAKNSTCNAKESVSHV